MTYDYELVFIKKTYTTNDIGDSIPTETRRAVLCDKESVSRSEHHAAAAHDLKLEIVFKVNKYEYEGESEVEYEGQRYSVYRTFTPRKFKGIDDFDSIELICQGLVNS